MTRRQLTDKQWKFIESYVPIGGFGPYPERLREQFEGVIWRFRTSSQWWEIPREFGPWPTVYGRLRVWRDAGVFTALLEGVIAEAARQGETDLSLVSVDSTTARDHHDAAGMRIGKEVLDVLEEVAAEQERARQKGGRPPEQNGQDGNDDPEQEERRRIRRPGPGQSAWPRRRSDRVCHAAPDRGPRRQPHLRRPAPELVRGTPTLLPVSLQYCLITQQ